MPSCVPLHREGHIDGFLVVIQLARRLFFARPLPR